jgi:hypothetical protein
MKKILAPFFLICLSAIASFGQDILTLKDGRTFKISVIEVGKKDVSYRKFDNPKGPIYRAEIRDIEKIDYESGTSDVFNSSNNNTRTNQRNSFSTPYPDYLGRNIIAIDGLSLLFQNVSLSYERIVGDNGKLGILLPVSINMGGKDDNNGIINARNIFNTGVDFHYYPLGQGEFKFYTGPSLRVGSARTFNEFYDPYYFTYISEETNSSYFSFLVKMGLIFNPVPELTIGTSLGIGTRRYFLNIPTGNSAASTGYFQFTLGYRF